MVTPWVCGRIIKKIIRYAESVRPMVLLQCQANVININTHNKDDWVLDIDVPYTVPYGEYWVQLIHSMYL